jgi:NAD(P)-dependent dehydrogenase (short-subunit alcohol dehydrogenase family)
MSKHYLVVGGSHGIGLELTRKLAEEGNHITVISRTFGDLAAIQGVTHHALDISKEEVPAEFIPENLDGLVYCPGSINLRAFASLNPAAFRDELEINLIGAVKSIQAGLKSLKKNPGSSIVLFSTVAVAQGMPFHSGIAAAKGAVEGLTRSLAAELAPGIRVNCIAPDLVRTDFARALWESPEMLSAVTKPAPLRRIGEPHEIAGAAVFLAANASTFMTVQTIVIDGGVTIAIGS